MSIKIYGTQRCAYCQKAKEWFESKNLAYEYFDVGADKVRAEEMLKLSGGFSVPTILINGNICVGWNPSRAEKLLESRGEKE